MKRLDLILNGKGGVGKSFFTVNLVQFLKDRGITHIAIDSDNENSTLKRFHPDTQFLDLDNRRELDSIFAAVEKANLVVMDSEGDALVDEQVAVSASDTNSLRVYRRADINVFSCTPYCEPEHKAASTQ